MRFETKNREFRALELLSGNYQIRVVSRRISKFTKLHNGLQQNRLALERIIGKLEFVAQQIQNQDSYNQISYVNRLLIGENRIMNDSCARS